MAGERVQTSRNPARTPVPARKSVVEWTRQALRPAASVGAVLLALLLAGQVVNGNHGLSFWQQKRAEDKSLQSEIHRVEQENKQMRSENNQLQNDPEAIVRKARENMHYARPDEVIVTFGPAKTAK